MEADVLTTSSNAGRGHFPGTTTGLWLRECEVRRIAPELPLIDFTELATGADYIHSAELVNMRYPRQTVLTPIGPGTP
jgi:hypothetical protein